MFLLGLGTKTSKLRVRKDHVWTCLACLDKYIWFCGHKHGLKMSWYLLENIQWFHTYISPSWCVTIIS